MEDPMLAFYLPVLIGQAMLNMIWAREHERVRTADDQARAIIADDHPHGIADPAAFDDRRSPRPALGPKIDTSMLEAAVIALRNDHTTA